jgi:hypothetical protein
MHAIIESSPSASRSRSAVRFGLVTRCIRANEHAEEAANLTTRAAPRLGDRRATCARKFSALAFAGEGTPKLDGRNRVSGMRPTGNGSGRLRGRRGASREHPRSRRRKRGAPTGGNGVAMPTVVISIGMMDSTSLTLALLRNSDPGGRREERSINPVCAGKGPRSLTRTMTSCRARSSRGRTTERQGRVRLPSSRTCRKPRTVDVFLAMKLCAHTTDAEPQAFLVRAAVDRRGGNGNVFAAQRTV